MNYTTHSENLEGIWVNVKKELPSQFISAEVGILKVKKADGTVAVNLYKEKRFWHRLLFGIKVGLCCN